MADRFSESEWKKIENLLEAEPGKFGMLEGGREKSLVIASFNIRKLGKHLKRKPEIDFLARFCACCDLVAVQEVQDNLAGLRHLKDRMESRIAGKGEYALAVSDVTGKAPGEPGMGERLAFLYRHRRVRRMEMATDLTFDRTAVLKNFFDNEKFLVKARRKFEEKMKRFRAKKFQPGPRSCRPSL